MTKTSLLDVNCLLALAWPNHESHVSVKEWFLGVGSKDWATCPLTELGFVRLSCNPAFTSEAKLPLEAIELLRGLKRHGQHRYFDSMPSVTTESVSILYEAVYGHKQITDMALLAIAENYQATLITLDRRLAKMERVGGCLFLLP